MTVAYELIVTSDSADEGGDEGIEVGDDCGDCGRG
jgi:hypothetical protein